MESLSLGQMEANALRDCGLANTWHAKYRCKAILEHTGDYFLHFLLPANEFRYFSHCKGKSRLLLHQFVVSLLEWAQNAALVFLLLPHLSLSLILGLGWLTDAKSLPFGHF